VRGIVNRLAALERFTPPAPVHDVKWTMRKLVGHPAAYHAACALAEYVAEAGIEAGTIEGLLADLRATRLANKIQRELARFENEERTAAR
jgi:hypothetical protein